MSQRIKRRERQTPGPNHPKLYCGSTAQYTERCLISMYQRPPKTTKGKIRCKNFPCVPIMKKPQRHSGYRRFEIPSLTRCGKFSGSPIRTRILDPQLQKRTALLGLKTQKLKRRNEQDRTNKRN